MELIIIKGVGPYGWVGNSPNSISQCPERSLRGVYLLTVEYEGAFVVHYAGTATKTTRTFAKRITEENREHEKSYARIYDKDRFAQAERYLLGIVNLTADT